MCITQDIFVFWRFVNSINVKNLVFIPYETIRRVSVQYKMHYEVEEY